MQNIIRIYPIYKELIEFPFRFKAEHFDKYNELLNNETLQINFKKWNNGINYKTNRKIKINGEIHRELKNIFIINCGKKNVLFDEFNGIDYEPYLLETKNMYADIDNKNKEIKKYNNIIDDIIEKINELDNWDKFVEFNSKKYGMPIVSKNIHNENNCNGEFIKDKYERCECSSCENWGGCNEPAIQYYKCSNCSYKISESIKRHYNYKGK